MTNEAHSAFTIQHSAFFLIVGDANADISAFLQHYPSEGSDSLINALGWSSGGSASNVAADLALLGGKARLLARVGTDPAAAHALQAARNAGVDLQALQIDTRQTTGLCFAAISASGERTLFSYRGANAALCYPTESLLHNIGWLHIGGHALIEGQQRQTVLQLVDLAQQHDIPISIDLCLPLINMHRQHITALLPAFKILFANQAEILALSEQHNLDAALHGLSALLPALTVIKMGNHGCLLQKKQGLQLHIAAPEVRAQDTTGCGDAFVAGFLYGIQQAAAPESCARFASICGAATARHAGAVLVAEDLQWINVMRAEI